MPTDSTKPTSTLVERSRTAKESKNDDTDALLIPIANRKQFDQYVKTTTDKYILVYFFATWCAPCKKLSMDFKELAEKYRDKLIILKINVDDLEEVAVEYNVTVMPAFTIVKDGEKLEHYFGNKTEQLDKLAEKYFTNTT